MPSFFKLSGGLVDRDDPRLLSPGDLTDAIGAEYRPGSDDIFTTGMRTSAGTLGSSAHTGLAYAQYDTADSKLIAGVGTALHEATAAVATMSGSQVTLDGSNLAFAATPAALVSRMQFERLYLASGAGLSITIDGTATTRRQNLIRKSNGTWMLQSLLPPAEPPVAVAQALTATTVRPATAMDGQWINVDNVRDSDDETRSHATRSSAGTKVFTWSLAALSVALNHKLKVLHGARVRGGGNVNQIGVGGDSQEPVIANLLIEYSVNGGSTYFTLSDKTVSYSAQWSIVKIPDAPGGYLASDIKVRATLTYTSGSVSATSFIHTIKVTNASATFPTAPLGFRYAVTEWDDVNFKESAISPESSKVVLGTTAVPNTTLNAVQVTLPPTRQNNRSTKWRIYRQPEGAAANELDKYGLIDELPMLDTAGAFIASQTYVDVFDKPLTEVASPALRIGIVGQGDDLTFYSLDQPVPLASSIDFYKGSQLLVPVDDPDNIYFTPPNDPENRPDLYAIPSRSPRNDRPLAVATCDNAWAIFFRNWTRRCEGLPLIVNGLFDAANYADASTTRGIAGPLAVDKLTTLSNDGSTWLVVADDEGVYLTNLYDFKPWTENLNWRSRVELTQLSKTQVSVNAKKRRVEVYVVLSGGTAINGRFDFFYGDMREGDSQPRISGPHPTVARGVASATISGTEERFTASGAGGSVYREDSGFSDASLAYNASGHVRRTITTGNLPIGGLAMDGYVRSITLRTKRGAAGVYATIAETATLSFSYGESKTVTNTHDPAAPSVMGVFAAGETLTYSIDDTGSTEKAEILGYYVETMAHGAEAGALRAAQSASVGSVALPTT